jgi:hypothetical protein
MIFVMFVSLTRVKTFDQPIENATIVGEEMLRWLSDIDGFNGLLLFSKEGSTVGLTFWESRDVAEQHRVPRREFLERMMSVAAVEIEEVSEYEVTFAHLAPLLAELTS